MTLIFHQISFPISVPISLYVTLWSMLSQLGSAVSSSWNCVGASGKDYKLTRGEHIHAPMGGCCHARHCPQTLQNIGSWNRNSHCQPFDLLGNPLRWLSHHLRHNHSDANRIISCQSTPSDLLTSSWDVADFRSLEWLEKCSSAIIMGLLFESITCKFPVRNSVSVMAKCFECR